MTARPTVALVDDDAGFLAAVAEALTVAGGFDVVVQARSAHDAQAAFAAAGVPQIVVVDAQLGDAHGATVVATVRRLCPDAKILALSAYADDETVNAMRAAGADAYLLKGAPVEELVAAIRALL